jgi:hypothetical protein
MILGFVVNPGGARRECLAGAVARRSRLHRCRDGEDGERQRDGPDALAGAFDALVHEAVRMTVLVLVRMLVLAVPVLVVMVRVRMRSPVRMGMTKRAMTMQIAFDKLISGRGHRPSDQIVAHRKTLLVLMLVHDV